MNKPRKSITVKECKIQASILLKSLNSHDFQEVNRAAKRFQRLPEFTKRSLDKIIHTEIKHKNALAVIALEKGFKSWSDLKCQLPLFRVGFLNPWFSTYSEAKEYQQLNGGFLFPYKNQFFICDIDYIKNLGFDSEDPDWKLIGYDWVNPENKKAWQRLYKQWIKISI